MKRVLLHVFFWIAYLSQDTLLAFLWSGTNSNNESTAQLVWQSFQLCAALVPPKIAFTYFMIYVIMDRILKQNKVLVINVLCTIGAIIIVLFSVRAIELYFVYPVLFKVIPKRAFFNPFGFLFAFIDLGYVSGIAIVIKQVRLQIVGKEREKNLVKEKLETELKFLRSQTNPHFLFNTLNNIYGLARRKSDDTAEAVMKLSKLLRFMLYESRNPLIKIEDEIKMLDNFINLEKIRYTKKLTVDFKREIDNEQEQVSPLLLLPFVENAFKYGVNAEEHSKIDIEIICNEENIVLYVFNNKVTVQLTTDEQSGLGIGNTRKRLNLLYPSGHQLTIRDNRENFSVTLQLKRS